MQGIIILSLVPLRVADDECSEMYSQLLFGERVEILETRERWLKVKNLSDNVCGWVDRKMIEILPNSKNMVDDSPYRIIVPILEAKIKLKNEKMLLPGGSLLPNYENGKFHIKNIFFEVNSDEVGKPLKPSGNQLISLAKQYLNSPYLWGGKSALGIDCSGLTQVIFSMCGIFLPRNAYQQAEKGEQILFLEEAQAGDLAFFQNSKGKIVHVGLLLNSHQIIHSSGWVKIENIDSKGIISLKTGEYSHTFHSIKRLI